MLPAGGPERRCGGSGGRMGRRRGARGQRCGEDERQADHRAGSVTAPASGRLGAPGARSEISGRRRPAVPAPFLAPRRDPAQRSPECSDVMSSSLSGGAKPLAQGAGWPIVHRYEHRLADPMRLQETPLVLLRRAMGDRRKRHEKLRRLADTLRSYGAEGRLLWLQRLKDLGWIDAIPRGCSGWSGRSTCCASSSCPAPRSTTGPGDQLHLPHAAALPRLTPIGDRPDPASTATATPSSAAMCCRWSTPSNT